MKALTLTQPWASLVARSMKQVETRSWHTSYTGLLAIHAAKGYPRFAKEFTLELQAKQLLPVETLPLSAIVALVHLEECLDTGGVVVSALERSLGDYTPGRFAWFFNPGSIVALSKPIPCRGALGLWTVPDEIAARLAT